MKLYCAEAAAMQAQEFRFVGRAEMDASADHVRSCAKCSHELIGGQDEARTRDHDLPRSRTSAR